MAHIPPHVKVECVQSPLTSSTISSTSLSSMGEGRNEGLVVTQRRSSVSSSSRSSSGYQSEVADEVDGHHGSWPPTQYHPSRHTDTYEYRFMCFVVFSINVFPGNTMFVYLNMNLTVIP